MASPKLSAVGCQAMGPANCIARWPRLRRAYAFCFFIPASSLYASEPLAGVDVKALMHLMRTQFVIVKSAATWRSRRLNHVSYGDEIAALRSQ